MCCLVGPLTTHLELESYTDSTFFLYFIPVLLLLWFQKAVTLLTYFLNAHHLGLHL